MINFLARDHDIKCHNLRYARIEYLVNVKRIPIQNVAEIIGVKNYQRIPIDTKNVNIYDVFGYS